MNKSIVLSIFVCLICVSTHIKGQEAIGKTSEILSPQINPDNTVTFRLKADQARSVNLSGDWSSDPLALTKTNDGVWTYTTSPMASNLYSYSFSVDGVRFNDPANVYINRDVATLSNIFIVGGGIGDLYKVNDVPHGSVTRRWYNSEGNNMSRRLTIYSPPGYEHSDMHYPTLYLLHGMGGDEEAWMALGRASQIFDNLIAAGKMKPMIVVMPNGNVALEAAPGESSLGSLTSKIQFEFFEAKNS